MELVGGDDVSVKVGDCVGLPVSSGTVGTDEILGVSVGLSVVLGPVGAKVGKFNVAVGLRVASPGTMEGERVGNFTGAIVGLSVSTPSLGIGVGVGLSVSATSIGPAVGSMVSFAAVGSSVGDNVVTCTVGLAVGSLVSSSSVSFSVGNSVVT